ncbi:VanZ family protein [Anaerocolumna xylanovorans]|uniref:VanZ like family protein n=1 Tax=Anaerocolumna xylanovorans DSM 12503 TaxID=1121345 RepID=A0A1M7YAG9_9FIRM|nr:VanZ family protein [Anaerocolumna xylanovorans]SHO49589.1 VanZ like family protein [Anaerocolumna xylanovorans DSM 12503]
MNKKRWLAWIPAILVMLMIFSFSSENGSESSGLSGSLTKSVVESVINMADLKVTVAQEEHIIESIHTPVRKLGHLSEYALLGITIALALTLSHYLKGKKLYLISLCLCILYASSDEIHQLFIPGRSGMVTDVGIDTIGALAGICIFTCICRIIRNKQNENFAIDKKQKRY